MNQLESLQDTRRRLVTETQKFLDRHTDADGKVSVEVAQAVEARFKDIELLDKQIDRLEAELSKPTSKPILNAIGGNYGGTQMARKHFAGITDENYRKEFIAAIRSGFKQVRNEILREGILSSGGYLVPTEMHDEIISELTAENIFRQIGKTITTASDHKIPLVTTKPTAAWVSEGADISISNETFGQISLDAHKLAVAVKTSNELLQDSFYSLSLEAHLAKEFADEFARAEENAMVNGTGDGQPKGILPLLSESASSTLQTTGADITADDLLTLMYSVDRVYRGKSVWLASDATLAQIRRLKTTDQAFIWEPSMQESEPPRLFGRPVHTSNFLPAPTAGNVAVIFGDFEDYFIIGERGQREFQPLRELYALSGQTAFLMVERLDSVFTNMAAIRGLKIRG